MSDEQTILTFLSRAAARTRVNRLLASLGNALSLLALLGLTVLVINLFAWLAAPVWPALAARVNPELWLPGPLSAALAYGQKLLGAILPLSGRTVAVLFGVGLLASLGLLLKAWLRPVSPLAVAQEIDRRYQLHDRLSSALDFARQESPSHFVRAALADAAGRARGLHPAAAVPLRVPRSVQATSTLAAYVATVAITLLIALALTASLSSPVTEAKSRIKIDTSELRQAVQALKEEAARHGDRAAERLGQKIDDILAQLERGELSKEEAMNKLADLQREIQQKQEGAEDRNEAMQQMASAFARSQMSSEVADELQQKNPEGASQELEKLADRVGQGETSEKQNESLRDALSAASKAAGNSQDQDLKQLGEDLKKGADQLEQGDTQGASQQLDKAAQGMKKLAEKDANNKRLDQAKRQLESARDSVRSAANQNQSAQQQTGQQPSGSQQESGGEQQGAGQQGQPKNGADEQKGAGQGEPKGDQNGADSKGEGLSAGAQPGDKRLGEASQRDEAKQKQEVEGEASQQPPPTAEDKKSDLTAATGYRKSVLAADKAAQEVINRDEVPPSYRRIVKKYFNSIKPKN